MSLGYRVAEDDRQTDQLGGYIFVTQLRLLRLEVGILEVCRAEVRAVLTSVVSKFVLDTVVEVPIEGVRRCLPVRHGCFVE